MYINNVLKALSNVKFEYYNVMWNFICIFVAVVVVDQYYMQTDN